MKVTAVSFLSLCLGIMTILPVKAQVRTDGSTSTTVTPTENGVVIRNGDRKNGNLFHSFKEFSVETGSEAFFDNANDVINIFSRVTGGKISNIDGLIRANGGANLFLINPAGIIFGNNASLQIGGSFYGSTADSIAFPEGEFSATNIEAPVLTINAPIGLNFRDEPGAIVSQSSSLQVTPGETLALIGGDLNFNGGKLTASAGRLELGSVKGESFVSFTTTSQGLGMDYDGVSKFGNIQLDQQAVLDTSGLSGGNINIQGEQLSIQNGSQTTSFAEGDGNAGDIVINAQELFMGNRAKIYSATTGSGAGANITITTKDLKIEGTGFGEFQNIYVAGSLQGLLTLESSQIGTGIFSVTSGTGKAGDITIETSSLEIDEGGIILHTTFPGSKGLSIGGEINVAASDSVKLLGSGILSGVAVGSEGQGGNTIIKTRNLSLRDGGIIVNATFGTADGGNIDIQVADNIELINTVPEAFVPTGILANSSFGTGQAGNVEVSATNIFAEDGGVINNNSGGLILNFPVPGEVLPITGGNAGNIEINVSNSIQFTGIGENNQTTSGINASAFGGISSAGNVDITTGSLVIEDGGRINAETIGSGQGGTIKITARDSIFISGKSLGTELLSGDELPSAIAASSGRIGIPTEASTGTAGDLDITTRELIIQDEGRLSVSSFGDGEAGNIFVTAESITLDNGGGINAATNLGEGGSIDLTVDDTINLQNNSFISAQALGNADGGNVIINAGLIFATPNQNSDIIASAEEGVGGRIDITAEGIVGLKEGNSNLPNKTNDIDASSEFGLDGNVSIEILDAGEFQEKIETLEIAEEQSVEANACSVSESSEISSLRINGRGGVRPQANDPLNSDIIFGKEKFVSLPPQQQENSQAESKVLRRFTTEPASASSIKPVTTAKGKIYPARGVIIQENGSIILTTHPTDNVQRIPHNASNCNNS